MYHVTLLKNLDSIKRQGLICQIGQRSQELGETEKAVYLFPNKAYADDAVANWLGDQFDDNEDLIMLPINIGKKDVKKTPDIDWECYSTQDIPAKLINFKHIIYCQ